mgnify:CR=1 FL=1
MDHPQFINVKVTSKGINFLVPDFSKAYRVSENSSYTKTEMERAEAEKLDRERVTRAVELADGRARQRRADVRVLKQGGDSRVRVVGDVDRREDEGVGRHGHGLRVLGVRDERRR